MKVAMTYFNALSHYLLGGTGKKPIWNWGLSICGVFDDTASSSVYIKG